MSDTSIATLGALRKAVDAGRVPHRSVQQEVRDNLIAHLARRKRRCPLHGSDGDHGASSGLPPCVGLLSKSGAKPPKITRLLSNGMSMLFLDNRSQPYRRRAGMKPP